MVKNGFFYLFAGLLRRRPSSSRWQGTSSPWRRSSLLTISAPHYNDDRLHGKKQRTSQEKSGKNLWHKRERSGFVREYSILRELRFTTLLHLLHLNRQNKNGIRMRCLLYDACCQFLNAKAEQNVWTKWTGIFDEIEKCYKEGLLFIFVLLQVVLTNWNYHSCIPVMIIVDRYFKNL